MTILIKNLELLTSSCCSFSDTAHPIFLVRMGDGDRGVRASIARLDQKWDHEVIVGRRVD